MLRSIILSVCLSALLATALFAQGTAEDYERAARLNRLTANKVFRDRIQAQWSPSGDQFWYRVRTGPNAHEFVFVDAAIGERRAAFDHERLAKLLREAEVRGAQADRLELDDLQFDAEGKNLTFRAGGKRWQCDLTTYELTAATNGDQPAAAKPEPAGDDNDRATGGGETWITFINKTTAKIELFWLPQGGEPVSYGTVSPGEEKRQHTFAGHNWSIRDAGGKTLLEAAGKVSDSIVSIDGKPTPRAPITPRRDRPGRRSRSSDTSPDRKWRAVVEEFNVVLRALEGDEEHRLSTDGSAAEPYDGRFFWSPDSSRLIALRTRPADKRQVTIVESSPRDQVQPKLITYDYLKPGDNVEITKPALFDVANRQQLALDDTLYKNPFSTGDYRWEPDGKRFSFLFNQRGHQALRIIAIDGASGAVSTIVNEESPTFIDYSGKQYSHRLDEQHELIWMSERDGWNHLYLIDTLTGEVKNQITKGPWVVRGVDRVDEQQRQIWFRAGGIYPEQDPYHVHFCRINFDGTGLVKLTAGDGTHSIEYSPDKRYLIDTWSRVDLPPQSELRRVEDGALVCKLESADATALLATGIKLPERFVAKARDGQTDIYGLILRPTNFDASKKYPVIEDIYAGPQSAFVPKGFSALHRQQALAELGFIIVRIDGLGTSHRSKAFHDVCWKNLGDAGLPDRILWMKAAAEKHPELDLARVGIFGGSAGGQNSLGAMLNHGDFYKVCVSDCGCHDNRMDKIWWNEQWMGWPIGKHYDEQSNVTQAHKLQGKLMLVVGELDRNVDPASTMQVASALVKANKDFDLLIIPGAGHGACETPYGQRRRQDFFVRHLLGVEPRRKS